MGKVGAGQVGDFHYNTRLKNRIPGFSPKSVSGIKSPIGPREKEKPIPGLGTAKEARGDYQGSAQRKIQRVLFKPIYSAEAEWGGKAHSGPKVPQFLSNGPNLPYGIGSFSNLILKKRGFFSIHRHQGCIPTCADFRSTSKISTLRSRGVSFPVCSTSIRSGYGPSSLHKDVGSGIGFSKVPKDIGDRISRRPSVERPVLFHPDRKRFNYGSFPEMPRLDSEYGKIGFSSSSDPDISRPDPGYEPGKGVFTPLKGQLNSGASQESQKGGKTLNSIVHETAGQDGVIFQRSSLCAVSLQVVPESYPGGSEQVCSGLGSSNISIPKGKAGPLLVGKGQQLKKRNVLSAGNLEGGNFRRQPPRLGNGVGRGLRTGKMVPDREDLAYQSAGNSSSSLGSHILDGQVAGGLWLESSPTIPRWWHTSTTKGVPGAGQPKEK